MNWKGRLSFKQFIPSKWRRFGIKQAKVNHAEPGRNLLLFNSYFALLQLLPMSVEVMFEGNGVCPPASFPHPLHPRLPNYLAAPRQTSCQIQARHLSQHQHKHLQDRQWRCPEFYHQWAEKWAQNFSSCLFSFVSLRLRYLFFCNKWMNEMCVALFFQTVECCGFTDNAQVWFVIDKWL